MMIGIYENKVLWVDSNKIGGRGYFDSIKRTGFARNGKPKCKICNYIAELDYKICVYCGNKRDEK